MKSLLLIDAIVRRTTVLVAQLSTSANLRAPLAHVAERVFLDLTRELDAQGVTRKVAADMFGVALRTYQKRVQRLTEETEQRERTLWESLLTLVETHGTMKRSEIFARLSHEESALVAAVLADLVKSGVLYRSGAGDDSVYGVTNPDEYRRLVSLDDAETLADLVWVTTYRAERATSPQIAAELHAAEERVREALATLTATGRVELHDDGSYSSRAFTVPLGSERGWEAAVLDHFGAVTTAIGLKVQGSSLPSQRLGGATLSFDVSAEHPDREEVLSLLERTRTELNELWHRVHDYNRSHPPRPPGERVTFYFGQFEREIEEHE